jgi:hypothetical protein
MVALAENLSAIILRMRNRRLPSRILPDDALQRGDLVVSVAAQHLRGQILKCRADGPGIGSDGFDEREAGQRRTMVNISSV